MQGGSSEKGGHNLFLNLTDDAGPGFRARRLVRSVGLPSPRGGAARSEAGVVAANARVRH
ncbi:hypothetical protein GCM10018966_061610 [Streptomyces yanii]